MYDVFIKALPGIIVAIFSSFLASRWALNKFYAEKWWGRKEQAYREIINVLYDIIQYFRIHKDDYGQGTGYSKNKEIEFYQKYEQSYWRLKKATDIASFYIPKKAEDILLELRNREQLSFDNNPHWDVYEEDYVYHQKTLEKIIEIARKDLNADKNIMKLHKWIKKAKLRIFSA